MEAPGATRLRIQFDFARHLRTGVSMSLRMRVRDREPIGVALRRFKKLLERSGLTREARKHSHYEKPSEIRRSAKLRKLRAIRKAKKSP